MNTLFAMFLVGMAAAGLYYAIWFGDKRARTSDHTTGVAIVGVFWAIGLLCMAGAMIRSAP